MNDDFAVFTEGTSSGGDFEDFWCINVKNLQERNNTVLSEFQAEVNRTPVISRRRARSPSGKRKQIIFQ